MKEKRSVIPALLFIVLTLLVVMGATKPLDALFLSFQSKNVFWIAITNFGSYTFLSALLLIVIPNLEKKEQKKIAYGFVSLAATVEILKNLIKRPRPIDIGSYAYPSGHSTLGFFVYFTLYNYMKKRNKPLSLLSLLLAFVVPLSRIMLGVHWLSDVIGGVLLASAVIEMERFIISE